MMDRRGFLRGLAGCFAAAAAPAVLPSGIIMPVRQIIVPPPIMPMEIGTWEDVRFIEARHDHSIDALRYMMEAQDQKLAARMARIKREILTHAEPREILGLGWGPDGYTALVHPSNAGLFKDTIKFRRLARG